MKGCSVHSLCPLTRLYFACNFSSNECVCTHSFICLHLHVCLCVRACMCVSIGCSHTFMSTAVVSMLWCPTVYPPPSALPPALVVAVVTGQLWPRPTRPSPSHRPSVSWRAPPRSGGCTPSSGSSPDHQAGHVCGVLTANTLLSGSCLGVRSLTCLWGRRRWLICDLDI